jgi:hypothetical protein
VNSIIAQILPLSPTKREQAARATPSAETTPIMFAGKMLPGVDRHRHPRLAALGRHDAADESLR